MKLLTPKDVDETKFTGHGFITPTYEASEVDEFMEDVKHTIEAITSPLGRLLVKRQAHKTHNKKEGKNAVV